MGVKYTYKIRTYKTFGDVTYNSAFGGEKTGSYVPAVKLKKFTSASAGTAKVTYNKAAKAPDIRYSMQTMHRLNLQRRPM